MECKETQSRTGLVIPGREGHRVLCSSKNVVYLLGGRGSSDADLLMMYNLTPGTVTFEPSSFSPAAEGEVVIQIKEVQQQDVHYVNNDNIEKPQEQETSANTASRDLKDAQHSELLKLKANLDALKEKRDMVARRAQQEADSLTSSSDNPEFAKLSGEMQSLRDELRISKSTNESLNSLVAELKKALQSEKDKNSEKEIENKTLELQVLEHLAEIQKLKSSTISDSQRVISLMNEIETLHQEKSNLSNMIEEFEASMEEKNLIFDQMKAANQMTIEKLTKQLEANNSDNENWKTDFTSQVAHLESRIKELSEEKSELKNSKDHEITRLKQQIEQNMLQNIQNSSVSEQQIKEEFEKKFEEMNNERESLLSEITKLNDSQATVTEELNSAKQTIESQQRTISSLERQLAEQTSTNDAYIAQLQEQLNNLQQKRTQQSDDHKKEVTQLQSQISTLNETVKTLQAQAQAQSEAAPAVDIGPMQDEILALHELVEVKNKELTELTQFLDELQNQNNELQDTVVNFQAETERLNCEIEQIRDELHHQTEENSKLQHSYQSLSELSASGNSAGSDIEIAKYLDKIREQEEEINRLESEVEQWMTASEELQKLGEDAVAEITLEADRLREEVAQWKKAVDEQTQRRREAEVELLNSESKLNDLDSMLRRLLGD